MNAVFAPTASIQSRTASMNSGPFSDRTSGMSIGDLLAALGMGPWFRDQYLLPFSGAIWSTPCAAVLDFPAETLVRFFENHALLAYSGSGTPSRAGRSNMSFTG